MRGKAEKIRPLLEEHYEVPLVTILSRFRDGVSCRAAAKILSEETGLKINPSTLEWLARSKANFHFRGKPGRKKIATLNEPIMAHNFGQQRIVHYACKTCDHILHKKEAVTTSLFLTSYVCEKCEEIGDVIASFFDKDNGVKHRKTLFLLDGKLTEVYINPAGEQIEPPIMVENIPQKEKTKT